MRARPAGEVVVFAAANHVVAPGASWLAATTGVSVLSALSLFSNPLFLNAIWLPWTKAWGQSYREFGLAAPRRLWLALVIALGAFGALWIKDVVIEPLYRPLLELWLGGDAAAQGRDWAFLRGNLFGLVQWLVLIWLFAAIGEEVFFRGLILRQIETAVGGGRVALIFAVLASCALFGLHHWDSGTYAVANSALSAPIYCAAFFMTGRNLLAPILAHGAWDSYGLTMLYLGLG